MIIRQWPGAARANWLAWLLAACRAAGGSTASGFATFQMKAGSLEEPEQFEVLDVHTAVAMKPTVEGYTYWSHRQADFRQIYRG